MCIPIERSPSPSTGPALPENAPEREVRPDDDRIGDDTLARLAGGMDNWVDPELVGDEFFGET